MASFFTDYIFQQCGYDISLLTKNQSNSVDQNKSNNVIQTEPEIPKQVLKDLVLNTQSTLNDDRELFMMFCGVDCLETIQSNHNVKQKDIVYEMSDQQKQQEQKAKQYLMDNLKTIKIKHKRDTFQDTIY